MKAGMLFSRGTSSLAAIMLARDYDVELNTCVTLTVRIPAVQLPSNRPKQPFKRRVLRKTSGEAVGLILSCSCERRDHGPPEGC